MSNGPEFAGRLPDQWVHLTGVEIDFSRPGKPTDNAHIKAFNSRLRALAEQAQQARGAA